MGTDFMRLHVKEENDDVLSVPPGFESFAAFTLKRVQDGERTENQDKLSCSPAASSSASHSVPLDMESEICDGMKATTKSVRRRPWINYGFLDEMADNEMKPIIPNQQNPAIKSCLPEGVSVGCSQCSSCQKVMARWRPGSACKPELQDSPVFYPTEEEFDDTLKYIASIRPKAEPYGICRIVPPSSWKPPFLLKDKAIWEASKFATRIQRVDKLQNRDSVRKVSKLNGDSRKKRRRCMSETAGNGGCVESFGFEPGPEFTLDTFQKYADEFKARYFGKNDDCIDEGGGITSGWQNCEPTVEDIEGEYWRIVEKATEELEVLYGADLETGAFGSGFPKESSNNGSAKDEPYTKSGWNLNNFPRLPGSVLSFESGDISGVLVPWLYIGMCFSSFCWHVEDHHLYSLNYMHSGAPKMWYGVSGGDATKFEDAMKKHLPDLFEEQPDLLHKLVTQLSPSILKSEGVPVYRCVQNAGEFVLTFPRAYHSGFNCGFNCAEAVNVAPVDWLPHGQVAVELYREQGRRTSISHDKLLLGAAREAVRAHCDLNLLKKSSSDNLRWRDVCGKDGILAKALKERVETERMRRDFMCNSFQAIKMDDNFDTASEKECSICLFDLHLSAAGCCCSPDKYSCLNHAKQMCSCTWDTKRFLFRYEISELNILVEALEGKLSAIYRWARLDLGFSLASSVQKDKVQCARVPCPSAGTKFGDVRLPPATDSVTSLSEKVLSNNPMNSTGVGAGVDLEERKLHIVAALKAQSSGRSVNPKQKKNHLPVKTELSTNLGTSVCQLSQEDLSYVEDSTSGGHVITKTLTVGDDYVIVLSDDEGEQRNNHVSNIVNNCLIDCSRPSEKLLHSDGERCNNGKSLVLPSPTSNADCMRERLGSTQTTGQQKNCSSGPVDVKVEYIHSNEIRMGDSKPAESSCNGGSRTGEYCKIAQDPMTAREKWASGAGVSKIVIRTAVNGELHNSLTDPHQEKAECLQRGGMITGSCPAVSSYHGGPVTTVVGQNIQDPSVTRGTSNNEKVGNSDSCHLEQSGGINRNNVKVIENAASNPVENLRSTGSPSCSQNNLDKYFRHKGPRIAKVVRRINCNVEPLELGVVLPGILWSNSQAIFPKGFRSRVKYISVLDPTSTSYYTSEIVDSERVGPLFMVSLESCQSEVFVHVSATRCWEMVRERVNQEINKQHKLGRTNLPPLQPPGSLDGFEMFGFSSPTIVQAIEALDRCRVCTDYWASRPFSRPEGRIPPHHLIKGPKDHSHGSSDGQNQRNPGSALRNLFKKASSEELSILRNVLCENNKTAVDRSSVERILNDELRNRLS